jgi:hypothetical protein
MVFSLFARWCRSARVAMIGGAIAVGAVMGLLPESPTHHGTRDKGSWMRESLDPQAGSSLVARLPWDRGESGVELATASLCEYWGGYESSIVANQPSARIDRTRDEAIERAQELRRRYPFFSVLKRLDKLRRALAAGISKKTIRQASDHG